MVFFVSFAKYWLEFTVFAFTCHNNSNENIFIFSSHVRVFFNFFFYLVWVIILVQSSDALQCVTLNVLLNWLWHGKQTYTTTQTHGRNFWMCLERKVATVAGLRVVVRVQIYYFRLIWAARIIAIHPPKTGCNHCTYIYICI